MYNAFRNSLYSQVSKHRAIDKDAFCGNPAQSHIFHDIVSRMLSVTVQARHGGAFVVLPGNELDAIRHGIRLKYSASGLDLGLDASRFCIASLDCMNSGTATEQQLREWSVLREKMMTNAEAAGNLSGVDGCVVLNQHLQVCGFGGEILVSESQAIEAPRLYKKAITGEVWDYEMFMKGIGGTRHKSAARLCKAHPGILVFVISQDGDLKIIYSDSSQVNAFGPLDIPEFGDPIPEVSIFKIKPSQQIRPT
jgi:hypothetical protein